MTIKVVSEDSEGNKFGLFGCLSHKCNISPDEIVKNNKINLVFPNYAQAFGFYSRYLEPEYRTQISRTKEGTKTENYKWFDCRRNYTKDKEARVDCKSNFSLVETFGRKVKSDISSSKWQRPWSLVGHFFHPHSHAWKYQRYSKMFVKDVIDLQHKNEKSAQKIATQWPNPDDVSELTTRPPTPAYIGNRKRLFPDYREPGTDLFFELSVNTRGQTVTSLNAPRFYHFVSG